MSANSIPNDSAESSTHPRSRYDERLARWEARQKRREEWGDGSWWGGAILILLGAAFLLHSFGAPIGARWWALFLMIPALGSFDAARHAYRFSGSRDAARGTVIGGLLFTFLTAMLLFDLNWGLLWPVVLVLVGIGLLR